MPAMATPTMASPTSIYPNPPPPPYTGWPPHPLSRPSGLISPPESRRTSDNKTEPPPPIQTGPQRQSLPSLKEALSAGPGPSPNPYVSPVSASLTHSQQQLPYSSQPPPVPRSYATDHPSYPAQVAPSHLRRASPLRSIIHPQSSTFSRPDPIPSFGESSRRTSFSGSLIAPGPPPNPYRDTRYEAEQRRPMTNGYSHYPAPPQHQPVPAHYVPRSAVPHSVPQSSFTEHRFSQSRDHPGSWKAPEKTAVAPSQFRQGLKRTLDVWGFELDLEKVGLQTLVIVGHVQLLIKTQIVEHSGSIQHWAQHYKQIASEQQTEIPDRMPTASSCQEQIDLAQIVMNSLVRARDIMKDQEYAASEESLRQQGGQKQADYDEEMSIYGDDSMKNGQGFNGEQSKKRRGVS